MVESACCIGAPRKRLADATLKVYSAKLDQRLGELLARQPANKAGIKLQRMIRRARPHLFVLGTHRDLPPTNNGSERALRPAATYRKVTNGFRLEWGAKLYADIGSVIETARRRSRGAIRSTLSGEPSPNAT